MKLSSVYLSVLLLAIVTLASCNKGMSSEQVDQLVSTKIDSVKTAMELQCDSIMSSDKDARNAAYRARQAKEKAAAATTTTKSTEVKKEAETTRKRRGDNTGAKASELTQEQKTEAAELKQQMRKRRGGN